MATTPLQSLLHHHHHHSFTTTTIHDINNSPPILLKLTTNTINTNNTCPKLFSSLSSSLTTASTSSSSPPTPITTTSPSSSPPSLDLLACHLTAGDFHQADEVTRRLLIDLAGEPARRRGYVFFSEVQFISVDDLRAIDTLWREHSNGRYGYSVQLRLWEKSQRDFTRFFIRVGWMKKLDTEVEQYNYRAFPDEFIWEFKEDTPEGHLPLTNALRGTQLLASILTHPAFEQNQDEEITEDEQRSDKIGDQKKDAEKGRDRTRLMTDFKPDYSF